MDEEEPSKGMIQPDPETAQRNGFILAGLLFLLAIVSFIGEIRGWWGLFGQIGMLLGTIGGLYVSFLSYIEGADVKQVRAVHQAVLDTSEGVQGTHEAVRDTHEAVRDTHGAVQDTHGAVRDTHEAVQENGRTLMSVDRKLEKLDELDVIQAQLDTQTGTLDRQLRVLEQIRDA